MHKTFKRFLSVALTLAMVFAMIPHMNHATVTASCEHNWVDSVCTLCHEECAHETWEDATCKAPKTCAACGKTEGVPLDHTLDGNKYCAGCETTFLAYFDFENVTFVEGSTTTLTDGSIITGVGDNVRFAEVKDGVLHLTNNSAAAKVGWYYPFGSDLESITLSYNVAIKATSTVIVDVPVFSTETYPSQVRFGARLSNNFTWKSKDNTNYENVTAGEGDNLTTFPYGSRWHTVKLVYSVDSTAASGYGYTLSVYLDGVLTNCMQINGNATVFDHITAQIDRNGQMYIDNVRVTAGDVDHVAATPTVSLCVDDPEVEDDGCKWLNGVCSACQAHCVHSWEEADCDSARTCNLCQMTTGTALGHDYNENGECQRENCDHKCLHEKFTDGVCDVCEYECPHTNRSPADCDSPETCETCGLIEGEALGHNMVNGECTRCHIGLILNVDFENETVDARPNDIYTNLAADNTSYSLKVIEVGGNKVLSVGTAADVTSNVYLQLWYELATAKEELTLTYNIVQITGRSSNFFTVANNSLQTPTVRFGTGVTDLRSYGYDASNQNAYTALVAADANESVTHALNKWHTVKVVYAKSDVCKVYIDGILTNVTTHKAEDINRIGMYLTGSQTQSGTGFYIDNIRVTEGIGDDENGSHEYAVPTSCLCAESQWGDDGICDVCLAHCEHDWVAANCTAPKTCSNCGKTEDAALGHDYNENGECQRENCDHKCLHEKFTDGVCDVCEYECPHTNRSPADCDSPETCETCGLIEGDALGHNMVNGECTRCHIGLILNVDFENEVVDARPNNIYTNLAADNTSYSLKVIEVGGNKVLSVGTATDVTSTVYLQLWYELATAKEELTLTYNIVQITGRSSNFFTVANSSLQNPTVRFGTGVTDLRAYGYDANNQNSYTALVAADANETVTHALNKWHTVKVVYAKSNVCKVYIDGILTNVTTHKAEDINRIGMYVTGSKTQFGTGFYIDNIRVTEGIGADGNGSHEVAVPTACLCGENSIWQNGVCQNCLAHCEHDWKDADCNNPKTCNNCGMIEGKALPHQYDDKGYCPVCKKSCDHKGEWLPGYVCAGCKYKCEHLTWNPATCKDPKTCSTCGVTEGLKGGDHKLVDNTATSNPKDMVCTECNEVFLAYLDFDGEPMQGALHNTSTTEGNRVGKHLELGGESVLYLKQSKVSESGSFIWYYDMGESLQNVTVSYNIAVVGAEIISFPVPAGVHYGAPKLDFGIRTTNPGYFEKKNSSSDWEKVLLTNGEDVPYQTLRWYTLKIVYSSGGESKVYIDGNETDISAGTGGAQFILAMFSNGRAAEIYIDNVRATTGNPDNHIPAVPTAPLCSNGCVVGDDGVCSVCHAVLGNYTHAVNRVNAVLGNTLDINFFIDTINNMDIGNGTYCAEIVHTRADGKEPITTIVTQDKWSYKEGFGYYVTYGVAAKEMGDKVTVTILGHDKKPVSLPYTDTIKAYIGRLQASNPQDEYLVQLGDDLLIYGAAAQKVFKYNINDLVSEEVPGNPDNIEIQEIDRTYWGGTTLVLESRIQMNVLFKADAMENATRYEVSYDGHNDSNDYVEYGDSEFDQITIQDTDYLIVPVTGLSIADYKTPVTVKIFDANGEVLTTVTDSMEMYVARNIGNYAQYDIYKAIIQVGKSAYDHFHKDIEEGYEEVTTWAQSW